jgi:hypothetical protein
MAAGYLPEPGTQYGPCADACAHTDCARTRQQAGMTCPTCGEQIGYERGFYQRDNWQVLVHAACAEDDDF